MPNQPRGTSNRLRVSLRAAAWWSMIAAAALLTIGGLRMAAVVFAPIVLGLVLALLLNPITNGLSRAVPRWLACIVAVALPTLVMAIIGWFLWYSGSRLADHASTLNTERYHEKWRDTKSWLTSHGVPESWLPGRDGQSGTAAGRAAAPQRVPAYRTVAARAPTAASQQQTGDAPLVSPETRDRLLRIVLGGLGSLAGALTTIGFALAFAFLALLETPKWRDWANSWTSPARSIYARSLASQSGVQVRRYLLAKTITGLASGTATWLFLWIVGVPLAFIWGGLTFILNFIPNIGALISGIPPTLLALMELGAGQALLVAAGLITIELLTGNLLDPLLSGDFLDLSPFIVLASLLFWGWVWGILGAVLAPMLTAAAITAAEQLRVKPDSAERDTASLA